MSSGFYDLLIYQPSGGAGNDSLTANGLTIGTSVGTPALTQDHALTATGLVVTTSVGTPALTQNHSLTASGLTVATSVGSPALTQNHSLTANGLVVATSVGTPALSQNHDLTASGLTVGTSVGTPALSNDIGLTANGLTIGTSVGTPTLSQNHSLTATGRAIATSVGTPALTQNHALSASTLTISVSVGSPTLTSVGVSNHALTALGLTIRTYVGSPALPTAPSTSTGVAGAPASAHIQQHTSVDTTTQPFPNLNSPIVHDDGTITDPWRRFFQSLWGRTGGTVSSFASFIAPGQIIAWAGATNPDPQNFLLCDGAAIKRSEYPELYAAIGTTWGPGDGSTTFNLPDFVGRTIVGSGPGFPVGVAGGSTHVSLELEHLPPHNHPIEDPGHNHTGTLSGHSHTAAVAVPNTAFAGGDVGSAVDGNTGSASPTVTVTTATTGITVGLAGGGEPFDIMSPYAAVNVYIRF